MPDLVRVSISIEEKLYKRLESLVATEGYTNRSEYVRDLIRAELVEKEWKGYEQVLGTLTLIYDHHQRGLSDKLTAIQHNHTGEILAATHVHLDHSTCAEMIMMKGKASELQKLAGELKQLKGVVHASLTMSTTAHALTHGHHH